MKSTKFEPVPITTHMGRTGFDGHPEPFYLTKEKTLTHCYSFLTAHDYKYSAVIAIESGDGYIIHNRVNEPCYGFLRKYRERSPNRPNDPRPSDLPRDFPDGTPGLLTVMINPFNYEQNKSFVDWYFSPTGPYASVCKDIELVVNKGGDLVGVIVHDTDVDATMLIHLFKYSRYLPTKAASAKKLEISKFNENFETPEEFFTYVMMGFTDFLPSQSSYNLWYYVHGVPSFETGSFKKGFDYNRPQIESLFRDGTSPNQMNADVDDGTTPFSFSSDLMFKYRQGNYIKFSKEFYEKEWKPRYERAKESPSVTF